MGAFTGKVGTLTTYNASVGNVARVRTNATNVGESASRTETQQTNRVRWSNMVNFYKASIDWMRKAFENKTKGHSDYNQFMSLNFKVASVAFTKEQAAAGACVVQPYIISQGSIPSIQVQATEDAYITNLRIGDLQITDETTVAEFSQALLSKNAQLRKGMQISFISYQQVVDDLGTPRVICTPYEMIINPADGNHTVRSYLPVFCSQSLDGNLATSNNISIGGFAYILSQTRNGKTYVSTQTLIVKNEGLLQEYQGEAQLQLSIDSYGIVDKVFLDSGVAAETDPADQPTYISYVQSYNGTKYYPNSTVGLLGYFLNPTRSSVSSIVLSTNVPDGVSPRVTFICEDNKKFVISQTSLDGSNTIKLVAPSTWISEFENVLREIQVSMGGIIYSIKFAAPAES